MSTDYNKAFSEIVARAWSDPAFKSRLIANPRAVAADYGFQLPDELEISVLENTAQKIHIVLPHKPDEETLTQQQLEAVVGGVVLRAGIEPTLTRQPLDTVAGGTVRQGYGASGWYDQPPPR